MSDINKAILTGRLGSEPEFKKIGDSDLAIFSIAVTQYRGGSRDADTAWWRCQLWGARSKVAEYLRIGSKVTVIGRLMVDTAEKDGEKRYYYYVDVDDLVLPDKGDREETGGEETARKVSSRSSGKVAPAAARSSSGKKPAPARGKLPF